MSAVSRRRFLKASIVSGAALGFAGFTTRLERINALGSGNAANEAPIYGPLSPKASNNTGEFFLSLPDGFNYNVIGRAGSPMTNGQPTPIAHDGMGTFSFYSRPNSWIIVRNHENQGPSGANGAVSGSIPYDPLAGGGTTTLVIDKQTRLVTDSFTSLSGTLWNCSGGKTPWGTWISCEETTAGTSNGFGRAHGYCFEVTPLSASPPVPLTQMGRFRHEAVAADRDGIFYLTEDVNPACGFYRFVPARYGELSSGGRLQILALPSISGYDTRTGQTIGRKHIVKWIDIPDPNPASAESDPSAVFNQGLELGGAVFTRLEGCYPTHNAVYFTSTNGGNAGRGQIWKYEPRRKSQFGWLTLVYESPAANVLDFPDNICAGPNENLFLCEDGTGDNYIRVLTKSGMLSDFAKNIVPGHEGSEFTGSAFSADFRTLFVNIQSPGITLAIWGSW